MGDKDAKSDLKKSICPSKKINKYLYLYFYNLWCSFLFFIQTYDQRGGANLPAYVKHTLSAENLPYTISPHTSGTHVKATKRQTNEMKQK